MRKIILLAFILPLSAEARFQIPDFVKVGSGSGETVILEMDPATMALSKKMAEAMKNPELRKDLQLKALPGQPLPYDSRFGFSEEDYKKLQGGLKNLKIKTTGQFVPLVIEKAGSSLIMKTPACSLLKEGAKVDLTGGNMTLPGRDAIAPSYFQNRTTPISPADGFQWSSGIVSISVVYRISTRNCILSCDVLDKMRRESVMVQYNCKPESLGQSSLPPPSIVPVAAPSLPAVPTRPEPPLGGSPATSCRSSLSRYPYVPPSMLTLCKQASSFSARAIDEYTTIYKGGMSQDLLEALLKVNSQERLDCALQIARKFDGSMTTQYFNETCL